MDKYQETFETWDKVAQLYEDKFMDVDIYNESYDVFCDSLNKSDASLLELGCGPGNITKYILHNHSEFKIKGTDVSPNMITLAQKLNPTAEFETMDCRQINEIKDKFDGIICGFILPYLSASDCSKLIIDCSNLLTNNGILYLSFVEGKYKDSGFMTGSTSSDRVYFYYHDKNHLLNLLQANSLELIAQMEIPYYRSADIKEMHSVIIVKKSR